MIKLDKWTLVYKTIHKNELLFYKEAKKAAIILVTVSIILAVGIITLYRSGLL